MKEKINIQGLNYKEVMVLVNCSKSTAINALKRGYYVVDYKKRTCIPGPIGVEGCYAMAWFVFQRHYRHKCPWNSEAEDLVQEAITRLVELGGHARAGERKFQFYTCFAAMRNYIKKSGRSNDLSDWRTAFQRFSTNRQAA